MAKVKITRAYAGQSLGRTISMGDGVARLRALRGFVHIIGGTCPCPSCRTSKGISAPIMAEPEDKPKRRRRGRPLGSRNKPKDEANVQEAPETAIEGGLPDAD